MRIKLTLKPKDRKCQIPINYQSPLSAAIYKILSKGSPEYADFLHERGYLSAAGKPLKLFTFSYLYLPGVKARGGMLTTYNYPDCTLHISSPMIDDFIQHLVLGLFENQRLKIGNRYTVGRFQIIAVESLPMPDFSETTSFKCLSPFVISRTKALRGRTYAHYLRPDDPELSEAVRQNLIQKYITVFKSPPENQQLEFAPDAAFIKRKGGPDKVSKMITLKEHRERETTRIKAIFCPFTMTGSTELMQIAWDAGLGTHCAQGFGCIEKC